MIFLGYRSRVITDRGSFREHLEAHGPRESPGTKSNVIV